jgi:hypothetical protein
MMDGDKTEVVVSIDELVSSKTVANNKKLHRFEVSDVSGVTELAVFLKTDESCPVVVGDVLNLVVGVHSYNNKNTLQFIKVVR